MDLRKTAALDGVYVEGLQEKMSTAWTNSREVPLGGAHTFYLRNAESGRMESDVMGLVQGNGKPSRAVANFFQRGGGATATNILQAVLMISSSALPGVPSVQQVQRHEACTATEIMNDSNSEEKAYNSASPKHCEKIEVGVNPEEESKCSKADVGVQVFCEPKINKFPMLKLHGYCWCCFSLPVRILKELTLTIPTEGEFSDVFFKVLSSFKSAQSSETLANSIDFVSHVAHGFCFCCYGNMDLQGLQLEPLTWPPGRGSESNGVCRTRKEEEMGLVADNVSGDSGDSENGANNDSIRTYSSDEVVEISYEDKSGADDLDKTFVHDPPPKRVKFSEPDEVEGSRFSAEPAEPVDLTAKMCFSGSATLSPYRPQERVSRSKLQDEVSVTAAKAFGRTGLNLNAGKDAGNKEDQVAKLTASHALPKKHNWPEAERKLSEIREPKIGYKCWLCAYENLGNQYSLCRHYRLLHNIHHKFKDPKALHVNRCVFQNCAFRKTANCSALPLENHILKSHPPEIKVPAPATKTPAVVLKDCAKQIKRPDTPTPAKTSKPTKMITRRGGARKLQQKSGK